MIRLCQAQAPLRAWQSLHANTRASSLGEADYQAFRPAGDADERFLATVGDILADWAEESGRLDSGLTIVTGGGGPESNDLVDTLQRWGFSPRVVDASSSDARAW